MTREKEKLNFSAISFPKQVLQVNIREQAFQPLHVSAEHTAKMAKDPSIFQHCL